MIMFRQEDRSMTGMAFGVAEVTKALAWASRACSKANTVVFVLNKRMGRRAPCFTRKGS